MTDLSRGIITFEEMEITPRTTKQDLLNVYGDKLSKVSIDKVLKFKRTFKIDNYEFSCWFYFDDNYNISSIKLTPYIEYKSESWDRTGQQEERRQFCDKWLFDRLGEPDLNRGGAEYNFDSVRISCVTHFDQHNGADAGYIVVTYK